MTPEDNVRHIAPADTLTPADRYQELFVDVQMSRVFEDSKTFVDCVPRGTPESILAQYRRVGASPGFDLKAFVQEHFRTQIISPSAFISDPEKTLAQHIASLWAVLTRRPKEHPKLSSLLPLPHDYIVPGGRFSELYYWDSYFTMLGLDDGTQARQLLRAMADNFAYLIDTYGHVPNGNRTYYLSRSQPPMFCFMVELFEQDGVCPASNYLPQLRKEYAFWMDGARDLRPGEAHRRCVRLPDGTLLNRYWDDRDSPREESYAEDVLTARSAKRPVHEVYRDLRAGAESGWDFSSRWQSDPADLATIRTTTILPVDLNCFLYKLETMIARLSNLSGDSNAADEFVDHARRRQVAIDGFFWNAHEGTYFDYDWQSACQRTNLTAASLTPLFVQVASAEQAARTAETVRARLLAPGGLSTTEVSGSGQQWDRPNGWACLQWIGIGGLQAYGHAELAAEISRRWLNIVSELYEQESKLVEKYILRPTLEHAGGGEYPLQDGFGWTNGVVARLLRDNPEDRANQRRAAGGSRQRSL